MQSIALDGPWVIVPPLTLSMIARITLVRIEDGAVLHEQSFPYRSRTYPYTEWAANDAQLFREALDSGYQTLAREIVEKLFLLYRFPSTSPGLKPEYPPASRDVQDFSRKPFGYHRARRAFCLC